MKKKDLNQEVKANVVSGMSSAAGSAAGVVIGSMATQEAAAIEATVAEDEETTGTTANAPGMTTDATFVADPVMTENHVESTVVDEPEEGDDVDVNVISTEPGDIPVSVVDHPVEEDVETPGSARFETFTLENGQQVDAAAIEVDGQTIVLADLDQDGMADIAFSDLDGSGDIEENEIEDISEMGIEMQQFQTAGSTDDNLLVQANDVDYVNDANVDMYYA